MSAIKYLSAHVTEIAKDQFPNEDVGFYETLLGYPSPFSSKTNPQGCVQPYLVSHIRVGTKTYSLEIPLEVLRLLDSLKYTPVDPE